MGLYHNVTVTEVGFALLSEDTSELVQDCSLLWSPWAGDLMGGPLAHS